MIQRPWAGPALLVAAVTLVYATLLSPDVTIQWDAVEYFYPYQRHVADSLRQGRLPFWTSTIFAGFPFLADLQVGAWYPLHWPFFLAGIQPKTMFAELWLHAVLAALGAWLLARRLLQANGPALLAGLLYGLSGYLTAHAQHVSLFEAACWLPLLLHLFLEATEGSRRWIAATILAGGALCLTGHFQTVLYAFGALWLVALWRAWAERPRWWRPLAVAAVVSAGAGLLSAVMVLPTRELVRESLRSRLVSTDFTSGMLNGHSLATFVWPNAAGSFDRPYTGPPDITQHYFYTGVLLLPLALVGLRDRRVRTLALWLIVPALVYSLGTAGGLFTLLAQVPGFRNIRGPSHAMFVATLGVVLLAAAGAAWLQERVRRPWVLPLLGIVFLLDLGWFNMSGSPLMYARGSYASLYGPQERWLRDTLLRLPLPAQQRVAAPGRWVYFYPAMAPFHLPVETTFGSNALLLIRWYDYMVAMAANPRLMSTVGVGKYFDDKEWVVRQHEPVLPRFQVVSRVEEVQDGNATRDRLATLDPLQGALVARSEWPGRGDLPTEPATGTTTLVRQAPGEYVVRVDTPTGGLLRVAESYFPGWRAEAQTWGGTERPLFPVDHALMGVVVPPGSHEIRVFYRPTYFLPGLGISLATLVACLLALRRSRPRDRLPVS